MKYRTGFTLTELLISISILSLLTIIIMANFQHGRRVQELRRAGTELSQNFRLAQSYTIGGNSVNFCDVNSDDDAYHPCINDAACDAGNGECINSVPPGGYGIHLGSPSSYKLFGDTVDDNIYDTDQTDYLVLDKYYTDQGISFVQYKLGDEAAVVPSASEYLDIVFEPPVGTITFYHNGIEATDTSTGQLINVARILVASSFVDEQCRTITINRVSGQVSEDQSACSL